MDAHKLLCPGGVFLFSLTVDTGKSPASARDAVRDAWAVHYGQYTPFPRGHAAYALAGDGFAMLCVTQRYDGLFNFICQRQ